MERKRERKLNTWGSMGARPGSGTDWKKPQFKARQSKTTKPGKEWVLVAGGALDAFRVVFPTDYLVLGILQFSSPPWGWEL